MVAQLVTTADVSPPRPAQEQPVRTASNAPSNAPKNAPRPQMRPSLHDDAGEGDLDVAPGRNWTIQIGAYADKSLALARLKTYAGKAQDVLARASQIIAPIQSARGHTLYRARFGLFAEQEAREVCSRLTQRALIFRDGKFESRMPFGFVLEQHGGAINEWVCGAIPINNGPSHATTDHVLNLDMDLRCRIRLVAHTNVIWFAEPAQQVAIHFRCRPAIKKRCNRNLADVPRSGIAVGLPRERVCRAGVVASLRL